MPINPQHAEEFDPVHGVPTVSQLLMELDQSELNTASADMQVSCMPLSFSLLLSRQRAFLVKMPLRYVQVMLRPFYTLDRVLILVLQNQWKYTSLQKAVQDFHVCFLDELLANNKDELAKKARKAAAQPTTKW